MRISKFRVKGISGTDLNLLIFIHATSVKKSSLEDIKQSLKPEDGITDGSSRQSFGAALLFDGSGSDSSK